MGFDEEIAAMQAAIIADARKIYSEKVVEHWLNPRNIGHLEPADAQAEIKGPCGDTMVFSLRVDEDKIVDIKFITDGCCTSIACGSVTTELVKGRAIAEALEIDRQTIYDAVGGLPEENAHCALLAANTLHRALQNYRQL